ncbi:hypothetical protein MIMGU_mgv11b021588mg [Erythranthe guttata]|uniref:SET domain-containing protein n=1 Tax=Erythranthe guttata TaxID=4155 RepID=A0A022QNX2_ERYGU|nr:hypothetical protein MIMGU_mgv11b021588mg [Erythranthe guttata]
MYKHNRIPQETKKIIDTYSITRSCKKTSSNEISCHGYDFIELGIQQRSKKEDADYTWQRLVTCRYTVEADGPIKHKTLIAEYAGDVDYIRNREEDDCDSRMTLISSADPTKSLVAFADRLGNISRVYDDSFFSADPAKSLVACAYRLGNISRFIRRNKQNIKCVKYNVDKECVVLLVANRDIAKGERIYYDYNGSKGEMLYYDYNGCEYEYPTHYFV